MEAGRVLHRRDDVRDRNYSSWPGRIVTGECFGSYQPVRPRSGHRVELSTEEFSLPNRVGMEFRKVITNPDLGSCNPRPREVSSLLDRTVTQLSRF